MRDVPAESDPDNADSTNQVSTPADPIPSAGAPGDVRFGMVHLVVWAAVCAVYLGIQRQLFLTGHVREFPTLVLAISSLPALSHGAELGGLVLLATRRFRRLAFPTEPGEWLLTALGARLGIYLFVVGAVRAIVGDLPTLWGLSYMYKPLGVLVFLVAARHVGTPPHWRRFLRLLVGIAAIESLTSCFSYQWLILGGDTAWRLLGAVAGRLDPIVPSVFLAFVIRVDLREPVRKPWTHWVGVAAYLWNGLVSVIWVCVYTWELV